MLWFASKLLAGIFSLAPNASKQKVPPEPASRNVLSTRSSCSTLVWDRASTFSNDCLKMGHSGTLKRARSDATLCSVVESNADTARGVNADADVESSPPRKKRRRTILEATGTESESLLPSLRDSYVQKLFSNHALAYAPAPSSSEVAQATASTTSQCARRDTELSRPQARLDLCHSSNVYATLSDVQGSVTPTSDHNEQLPAHPASPRVSPSASISFNSYPSQLSSRPAAPEGEVTRIEIPFEKLHQELLRSSDHDSLIQEVAQRISTSSRWIELYNVYKGIARHTRFYSGAGFRKNRFMDLMNLIVEEAPRCGLDVPYTHQLRYGRYHYDGSKWSADCEDESSASESRSRSPETFEAKPSQNGCMSASGDKSCESCDTENADEPFRNDSVSPCIGTIEGGKELAKSAWERAAVIVDVYNPSNEWSPRESKLTSLERKSCQEVQAPPLRSRPRRVKGIPHGEHDPYPRMSWIELEEDFYSPRKFDSELAANANRLFRATGNRRHVVGVYVNRMKVRFCFYDRAGTIYTTPLDLRSDAQRIIAAFISLSYLDAFSVGLEPYLAAKTPTPPSSLLQGTESYYVEVDGLRLRTNSLLHAGEVFGRATAVYSATLVAGESSNSILSNLGVEVSSPVALKLSWHTPSSRSEDELLRLAEECGVQGVARLYRSTVADQVSEGLRSRLVPAPMYADRELRVQVIAPLARPLCEIGDLGTFKAAFISLVKIHHDLFEKAGILHRDISVGNLMVDASNPTQGVLIDLDFAVRVAQHGDPLDGGTFPPAGTLIFRAFDLITPDKPLKAYYRHDLESFLYTLLWIQTHYLDGKKYDHPEANHFDFNFNGTWNTTQGRREGFLISGYIRHGSQLPLTSLRDHWLTPLRRLFGDALIAESRAFVSQRQGKGVPLDRETFGGRISYETFIEILQR